MLRSLTIKNFILIESVQLEFQPRLNVLTGETGAGKSIVVDAIQLLFGERFSADLIRAGADRASISGCFDAPGEKGFARWLHDKGFESTDEILVRREATPDGRSRAFLNDQPVTLGTLAELGGFIVDIHGQHQHQHILKPSTQRRLVDQFGEIDSLLAAYQPLYERWKDLREAAQAGRMSEEERLQRLDVVRFQVQELEQARLQVGEEEAMSEKLPALKNAEKLRAAAEEAHKLMSGDEGSALERLGKAGQLLDSLTAWTPSLAPVIQEYHQARQRLEEISFEIQQLSERWQADPEELDRLLSRLDLISRLKKKYGATIPAMLEKHDTLKGELDRLENADRSAEELQKELAQTEDRLRESARSLHAKRKQVSKRLSQAVEKQLGDLGLEQAVFQCSVLPDETPNGLRFGPEGADDVSFLWSPNPGEGIRPLKEIASGGEMSRVMLALKTVLATADAVPILVFDEIDAGIGGITAQAVGQKLRALSAHHQIFCVTHLPQIASSAHAHFHVSKHTAKARTTTDVHALEGDRRAEEVARLLGSQPTQTSLKHAQELLSQHQ